MNGDLGSDPCAKCKSCGTLAFLREDHAMGGLWLEDSLCNNCRNMEKLLGNMLWEAFIAPSRWRRKLIKWIFPEIIEVADFFREKIMWRGDE